MDNYNSVDFGCRLAEARKRAKITQEELGDKLGVNRVMVARYEAGKVKPGLDRLCHLAKLLAVSTDWMLFGSHGANEKDLTSDELRILTLYRGSTPERQSRLEKFAMDVFIESQQQVPVVCVDEINRQSSKKPDDESLV